MCPLKKARCKRAYQKKKRKKNRKPSHFEQSIFSYLFSCSIGKKSCGVIRAERKQRLKLCNYQSTQKWSTLMIMQKKIWIGKNATPWVDEKP